MKVSLDSKFWVALAFILCQFSSLLLAQDSSITVPDTSKIVKSAKDVEVELMEITIEAVIEKPRVAILPKRMEPEIGEMELIDRSFENELKQGPKTPFFIKERATTPIKIKKLKKKLEKKDN